MTEAFSPGGHIAEAGDTPAPGESNRRLVLKTSLATLAALGPGSVSSLASAASRPAMSSDEEILNFALNLEYLEAEFYLRAVFGTGLSADETNGKRKQGQVVGGSMVNFTSDAIRQYATEIAKDERDHVDFLRSVLGKKKVAEPDIDLKNSFNILAQAAGLGASFDPFASDTNFILGAFIFEDVGVTAYHGAAPLIQNPDYLDAAAGILAVEAYHAGVIRLLCYQAGLADQCGKISDLRNKLSAAIGPPAVTDQGIVLNGMANLVPADENAIAFERTAAEVLNIVYAGGKSGDFGFFPNKVNGDIH